MHCGIFLEAIQKRMDVAARSSMCAGEDMWCVRFMRCKRDIERLAAMSELKLDDANPVRAGRGETCHSLVFLILQDLPFPKRLSKSPPAIQRVHPRKDLLLGQFARVFKVNEDMNVVLHTAIR